MKKSQSKTKKNCKSCFNAYTILLRALFGNSNGAYFLVKLGRPFTFTHWFPFPIHSISKYTMHSQKKKSIWHATPHAGKFLFKRQWKTHVNNICLRIQIIGPEVEKWRNKCKEATYQSPYLTFSMITSSDCKLLSLLATRTHTSITIWSNTIHHHRATQWWEELNSIFRLNT